jgi:hypothetical protein
MARMIPSKFLIERLSSTPILNIKCHTNNDRIRWLWRESFREVVIIPVAVLMGLTSTLISTSTSTETHRAIRATLLEYYEISKYHCPKTSLPDLVHLAERLTQKTPVSTLLTNKQPHLRDNS